MLVLASQLIGLPVFSLQTGTTVAQVSDILIGRERLDLLGFSCLAARETPSDHAILLRDIREINAGIFIDSADEICHLGDIVRLRELAEKRFSLAGLTVKTESGQKLGKIEDYGLDPTDYLVHKLYVRRPFFSSALQSSLTIDHSQIIDVTDSCVIVRDATNKSKSMGWLSAAKPAD